MQHIVNSTRRYLGCSGNLMIFSDNRAAEGGKDTVRERSLLQRTADELEGTTSDDSQQKSSQNCLSARRRTAWASRLTPLAVFGWKHLDRLPCTTL